MGSTAGEGCCSPQMRYAEAMWLSLQTERQKEVTKRNEGTLHDSGSGHERVFFVFNFCVRGLLMTLGQLETS